MNIGIPKECRAGEARVGLIPAIVSLLIKNGHACYLETGAGENSGFDDYDYARVGAKILPTTQEVYQHADVILKVLTPTLEEIAWMREGQTLMGLLGMVAAPDEARALQERRITAVAYEMITADGENYPILKTVSEVAGRMAPYIAGMMSMHSQGGRGILLNGVPGVSAGEVVILGAGTVGVNAARGFLGLGAKVFILSPHVECLRKIDTMFEGRVTTMVSHAFNIAYTTRFADVVIGAARVPGERAPRLLTREMLRTMRRNAAFIDFSIDHGGCAETSRPTTLQEPLYVEEDVLHYCVPNVPGAVPRTSTQAISNAAWPYIEAAVSLGVDAAIAQNPALEQGVVIRDGAVTNPQLAAFLKR